MSVCIKRLRKELGDVNIETTRNTELIEVKMINDDLFQWTVNFHGQKNSPFEGGIFNMSFVFPKDYPFKPPKVKMNTKVYHPNISETGDICLDLLKDQWSPTISMYRIIISIKSLLIEPNINDPLNPDVARHYRLDKDGYHRTAKEWVVKFATI